MTLFGANPAGNRVPLTLPAEPVPPEMYSFMANINAAFVHKILNIP